MTVYILYIKVKLLSHRIKTWGIGKTNRVRWEIRLIAEEKVRNDKLIHQS